MQQAIAIIESLDQEGRGVTHVEGKAIFIEGALPGEKVTYVSYRNKPTYEFARVDAILRASPNRAVPKCPHFGVCGGCAMQHLELSAQVAAKQRMLEDALWHLAKVRPETMLPPIVGPAWGYRHKARMQARYVPMKGRVLVGFNEKRNSKVAVMGECHVLPPHISALIVPLQELLARLSIRDHMPQVEVAVGEHVSVLVFRIMAPIEPADEPLMREFADAFGVQIWLQTKGPDTAVPFYPPDVPQLSYSLPEYDLVYPFRPTEFTQVNPQINRVMIRRAMNLLDPQPGERIADFFCGLGNFTLPIARLGASVLGMEGSASLLERARACAALNGLSQVVDFREADLFEKTAQSLAALGRFEKWLIDPPRDGAAELIRAIEDDTAPQRIVYVSCNPSTLARDAGMLVQQKGYAMLAAGIINMFPHTAHVETIALFEKR
ncbi:23S rRNA (uracil(1939)-C(5))-methyltransferase RlmD [mine drainage metagenome]|uniref:23S rRNA (Uracil(1939)-C(5))-methyltransferase RlmD n=1 Tax=mine drainage metagenome TaxID=410659 RepID=A0A1J5R4Z9_9ZZZZ